MKSAQKKLIRQDRQCCCCADVAKFNARTERGHRMLAITCLIYRRGSGKGRVHATHNVPVCEACMILALAGSPMKGDGYKLFSAIQQRLTGLYNKLRAESDE